jgi:hypothetical protein
MSIFLKERKEKLKRRLEERVALLNEALLRLSQENEEGITNELLQVEEETARLLEEFQPCESHSSLPHPKFISGKDAFAMDCRVNKIPKKKVSSLWRDVFESDHSEAIEWQKRDEEIQREMNEYRLSRYAFAFDLIKSPEELRDLSSLKIKLLRNVFGC